MSTKKKTELTMSLFRKPDGTERLFGHDATDSGTNEYWVRELGAYMGEVTVTCEYESIGGDPTAALISNLEKAVEKERVYSHVRVNALLDRISRLKCLTHEAPER